MKSEFSYKNLNDLFKIISRYRTSGIKNFYLKRENCIVMRHDIDISLKKAVEFAKIESKYDINATYFIMTTSPMYNIHFSENRDRIKYLLDMGFEVGLHFDPSIYCFGDLEKYLSLEVADLSSVANISLESYAVHNPSLLVKKFHSLKYTDAWDETLFEDSFATDSRMEFPDNIINFLEMSKINPVQLGLHPEHYSEEGYGYDKIFSDVILDFAFDIDNTFSVNSNYAKVVGSILARVKIS